MRTFLETHKMHEQGRKPDATRAYPDIPVDLKLMLQHVDGNTFANGFFRFVGSAGLGSYFSLWNIDPKKTFPFIKSGFGHLVFYYDGQYKVLNPIYNCVDELGDSNELDFVMNVALCDRPSLENSFLIDMYEQAFPRLGVPRLNEIYAFVPALGLGGGRESSNVVKADMKQQMSILSQL